MISVPVQIDRASPVSLRAQVTEAYASAIRNGQLPAGTLLPSVRALSGRLCISPVTVAAAYRELCDTGLAKALPRSGVRVAECLAPSPAIRQVFQLNRIEPDLRLHPVAACSRLMSDLAAADPVLGGYADYRGDLALREAVALLDAEIGILSDPVDGVLITSGAQQALSLIGRSLAPGATVAVEDPCYPGARLAFSGAGATLFPLAMDEDGPAASGVALLAQPGRIAALYGCPSYANPTGRCWSETARRRVLQAAQLGGTLLIEDDYLGDLDAPVDALPRLAQLAPEYPGVRVVRIHTFSKTLLPALRLASVAGDPALIERLLGLKVADDLGCSALLQRALAVFIQQGHYRRHLELVRPHYAEVRRVLRTAFSGLAPVVQLSGPEGGFCLLGKLAAGIDTPRFLAECSRLGVLLTPGADYWLDGTGMRGRDSFRIGFGSLNVDEVPGICRVLERAAATASTPVATRSLL